MVENVLGLFPLAASGFKEAAQDRMVLQSVFGTRALNDFAQDDHRAQTPLGLAIRRHNIWVAEAGEKEPLTRRQLPGR